MKGLLPNLATEVPPGAFPEATAILDPLPGMKRAWRLPVYQKEGLVVSSWVLSWRARLAILLGARVWMHANEDAQPAVVLTVSMRGPWDGFPPTVSPGLPAGRVYRWGETIFPLWFPLWCIYIFGEGPVADVASVLSLVCVLAGLAAAIKEHRPWKTS